MSEKLPFEKAYSRLEEILQKMNSSALSLDDSIKFFEEARKLISMCEETIADAERKIEKLVKSPDGAITTEPFAAGGAT